MLFVSEGMIARSARLERWQQLGVGVLPVLGLIW